MNAIFAAKFAKTHKAILYSCDILFRFSILSFYQTSTLPLWFKSKSTIEKISGGETHMLDNAYVHGASEGSVATMPVAHRLHEMGVNVHAYPAAVPNYVNTDVEIMKRMCTYAKRAKEAQ